MNYNLNIIHSVIYGVSNDSGDHKVAVESHRHL